jgi:hypothetical protein
MGNKNLEAITGQCHCGSIQYQAQLPIVESDYCDCQGCQKATGTFEVPFVTVYVKNFKIISGQIASFRAEHGEGCDENGTWNFCPKCGTQLFWKEDQADELTILAGTLDDVGVFQSE